MDMEHAKAPLTRLALPALLACFSVFPLSAAEGPDSDRAAGGTFFDGAAPSAAKISEASPAGTEKRHLAAELKKLITFDEKNGPEEKALLDSLLSKMLDSPTGRETAGEFIKAGARAKLSLSEIPGSVLHTVNGKKIIKGTRGFARPDGDPPLVVINELFRLHQRENAIEVLSHEMTGHVLEAKLVPEKLAEANTVAVGDEEISRINGWLTATELGVEPSDTIWSYMQNQDEYRRMLKTLHPYYATTLTLEEMKNPVPVYKEVLATAEQTEKELGLKAEKREKWDRIADHFINEHKMNAGEFTAIKDEISNRRKNEITSRDKLSEIKAKLAGRLKFLSTKEGARYIEYLAASADSGYFKERDEKIKERRERLASLLLGKTPGAANPPPVAGQLTWEEFEKMWAEDEKNCPHGGLK